MILSCQSICKSFGEKVILQDASFHIEEREKAALIGNNGAGKTTLLRIIMEEISADSGQVVIAKDKKIGYLAQYQDIHGHHTIYEELMTTKQYILDMEDKIRSLEQEMKYVAGDKLESLMNSYTRLTHQFELENGYAYKSEIVGVLKGLGFEEEDYGKQIENLSGGQKTRVALGKLLISKPDILLLDEPTNHLDMESIAWLETYLLNYPGAVFIVSHDRYFLDKVVTKIVEIEAAQMRMYEGNYSAYALKKAQLRDAQYKAYLNQQREIKHQEAVITKLRSFNREKSIKRAESRVKMLDKIQRIEKPIEIDNQMRISLEPRFISGNDVLTVEGLSKAFPGQTLFTDINFEIKRGERVALIGNNGTGKTTILKILNGIVDADAGRFALGSKVQIGYYDQEHHVLHMEKTIFQEISDTYPTLTETEIRNMLAAFLFTGDDVFKLISSLSGGERGRVSLAKLMLSEANFLILDEPTNHLDIASKEILEEALNSYTGTVLYVSHDRYFINQTATRIMDLTNQAIVNYIGDYDYYLEKKEEMTRIYAPVQETAAQEVKENVSETKLTWQQQKEEQALKRKRENELKKVERRIEELETRDKEIDETMVLPDICTNVAECTKLSREKAAIAEELEELYEKWEELA
ncbi:ABC-F family ATP-binding cassette domain-containing protein [Blautia faecis]|uniref:ABC-F family ATP-binding cassette domain-containing protein n=1 Tax=Blautia faecis TaxID=871665 RepID=UPI00210ADF27|nr:ABC-F family ATP-binding cassette domain-containing protein [Blautia faecis]MCQ4932135.1 ABC-F family ATP-binding cassette domain-containing protein [Blautia faecis]